MIEIRITGATLEECLLQLRVNQINVEPSPVKVEEAAPEVKEESKKPPRKTATKKESVPEVKEESVKEEPMPEPPKEEQKPEPPKEEPKPENTEEKSEPSIEEKSFSEVRSICVDLKENLGVPSLKDLLARFGATRFSEVKPEQYPALYAEAERMIKETEAK